MAETQPRGTGRIKFLLVTFAVVAALGGIAYLAGKLNTYRFFLVKVDRELVVHQGAPIPFVTRRFVPSTDAERLAYSPIRVTARWSGPRHQSFEDRGELDRAIYTIMEERLEEEFYGGRLPNLDRVNQTMARIEVLTGLTDEDRGTLEELRGDYAYIRAREIIEGLPTRLSEARRLCEQAEQRGSGRLGDPRQLSQRLAQWMQLLSQGPAAQPLPPPQTVKPEPAPPPPAPAPPDVAPVEPPGATAPAAEAPLPAEAPTHAL